MENETKQKDFSLPASIIVSTVILAMVWIYTISPKDSQNQAQTQSQQKTSEGIVLPVRWGDLGKQMISAGVIDAKRFEEIYANRGGLTKETKELLYGANNGNLKVTSENSGIILNLLWALGLGAKNNILEAGPMTQYGDTGNFASTGGWTIAQGGAMQHYSKHDFFFLTAITGWLCSGFWSFLLHRALTKSRCIKRLSQSIRFGSRKNIPQSRATLLQKIRRFQLLIRKKYWGGITQALRVSAGFPL